MSEYDQTGCFLTNCCRTTVFALYLSGLIAMSAVLMTKSPVDSESVATEQATPADNNDLTETTQVLSHSDCTSSEKRYAGLDPQTVHASVGIRIAHQAEDETHANVDQPVSLSGYYVDDQGDNNTLVVYMANCRDNASLVQVRSTVVAASGEAIRTGAWDNRRVPNIGYLVYTVELPSEPWVDNVQLLVKGKSASDTAAHTLVEFELFDSTPTQYSKLLDDDRLLTLNSVSVGHTD